MGQKEFCTFRKKIENIPHLQVMEDFPEEEGLDANLRGSHYNTSRHYEEDKNMQAVIMSMFIRNTDMCLLWVESFLAAKADVDLISK